LSSSKWKKNFVGSGWKKHTDYGVEISLSLDYDKLDAMVKEGSKAVTKRNGYTNINIKIAESKPGAKSDYSVYYVTPVADGPPQSQEPAYEEDIPF